MSKVQTLRAFVKQRLAAAAEEILELVERTMAEREEEVRRQHGLMDAAFRPAVRIHRAVVQQRLVSEAVVPPELQERSPCLETESEPPEPQHIGEEQQRAVEDTPVTVKTAEDDEDGLQPSLLHQSSQTEENTDAELLKTEADGEDCGGPEPARSLTPDTKSPSEPENDDGRDDTREPQSGSNPLQSHEEPLIPTNTETMEDEKQQQQPTASRKKHMVESSSDDEDSDVEKNFILLTERGRGGGGAEEGEQHHEGEEEEELSDEDDDEESDGGEEEEVEEEGSDAGEEESEGEEEEGEEEEDGDSEASVSDDDDDDDDEDDEDPEEAGGSSEIQTREDMKTELSNMSFEDVLKLQNKVGTKVYNEVAYGGDKSQKPGKKKKRLNKNRPVEISAKRPAPFLRQVVSVRKPMFRDPRFDDLSGEYKPEIFEKTFKFINDIKHREKEVVQKQLRKTKNNHKKTEKLQFLLKRMENQERARASREQQRERELHFKRLQRERANQGARPFFLKNSEKKKLQLAEKYEELKKSGKLENFLSKKRKRNAGKDRRKLPKQAA